MVPSRGLANPATALWVYLLTCKNQSYKFHVPRHDFFKEGKAVHLCSRGGLFYLLLMVPGYSLVCGTSGNLRPSCPVHS